LISQRSLLIASAVFVAGCGGGDAADSHSPTGPLARVLVDSAGGVQLDGRPITLLALADSLRALQPLGGAVLYSRTPPDREPNAAQEAAMRQVLRTVGDLRLPIRLLPPDSLQSPDSLLRN
jgi:hypothetical protein